MAVYGVLMLGGGAMAYAKAHSAKSLIAGIVSAALIGVAFFLSRQQPRIGFGLGAAVAIGLVVVFVRRIQEISAQTPPGPIGSNIGLAVLSGFMALYLLFVLSQAKA